MQIKVTDLGKVSFKQAFSRQIEAHNQILLGLSSHTLFLCEHPHTITLPRNSNPDDLLDAGIIRDDTIDFIVGVNRGGAITYHGPGQLVGYLVFDLREYGRDLGWFLSTIEEIIIKAITKFGIEGYAKEGFRGVWVDERKIASIGIGIDKWVSMHGFALNVNTDLGYFDKIRPCGLDVKMTSMKDVLGVPIGLDFVKRVIVDQVRTQIAKRNECFQELSSWKDNSRGARSCAPTKLEVEND